MKEGRLAEVRVQIDLNVADADGLTIVLLRDATGTLHHGRRVTAYESEGGVCAPAVVERIHPDQGVAFIRVDWAALANDLAG